MKKDATPDDQLAQELRRFRRTCRAIARDIHDGPFHDMTGVSFAIAAEEDRNGASEELATLLGDWHQRLSTSLARLRRAIHRLERLAAPPPGRPPRQATP